MKKQLTTISIAFICCLNIIYGQTDAEIINKIHAAKTIEELPAITTHLIVDADFYKIVSKKNDITSTVDKFFIKSGTLKKGTAVTLYKIYNGSIEDKINKGTFDIDGYLATALISEQLTDSSKFMPVLIINNSFFSNKSTVFKAYEGRRDTLIRKAKYERHK